MFSKIAVATSVFLLSCSAPSSSLQSFQVNISGANVDKAKARRIALQYLSLINSHDYDGGTIDIAACNTNTHGQSCDYYASHLGNGCGWGAPVTETCDDNHCEFEVGNPYEGPIICE